MKPLLSARPRCLEAAAEALPPPKGQRTEARVRVDQLRAKLLAAPVERLTGFRATPRARAALPTLAVEPHPALRERVLTLARQEVDAFRWETLGRLLRVLWEDEALREGARRRAEVDSPGEGLPPWLSAHWRAALGADPPGELARVVSERPVAEALSSLGLSGGSPLGEATLSVLVDGLEPAALDAQPFTRTLRWIERSGDPPALRRRVLVSLLNRWLPRVPDPGWLEREEAAPIRELLAVARARLGGGPRDCPGLWAACSAEGRALAEGWSAPG